MKSFVSHLLVCPVCLPWEIKLSLRVMEDMGEDIESGYLRCPRCNNHYPIVQGIAYLLPPASAEVQDAPAKYERSDVVSWYLWSHYGDLLGDEEATPAYSEWASHIHPGDGFSLDAGCAVGRFTFEMSRKSGFAVGLDSSCSFIRTARELLLKRHTQLDLAEEGRILTHRTLHLPPDWDSTRVEFIVGDAQALPFSSDLFARTASLNMVDKLPKPLAHLQELDRVARRSDAQFLFSDPFSWSSEVACEEDWLGGLEEGKYAGRGFDNVKAILTGKNQELTAPWDIEDTGDVWWKIRTHCNHFELIRSWFVSAAR